MVIAVTGATGALGSLTIKALQQRTTPQSLVAIVRDPDKASNIADAGVVVRQADYDEPESLAPALEGVDRLLLISGNDLTGKRFGQHKAVIDAAKAAGVQRIFYTSVLGADNTSLPVAPDHVETEAYLKESGVPYTVLRNGWYNENYLPAIEAAKHTGLVATNAADGKVASAARADFAEAAAVALTTENPQDVYELAGDLAWTQEGLAEMLSEVLGSQVSVHNVSAEEHAKLLSEAGLPEGMVSFMTSTDTAIAAGDLARHAGGLGALIGRPTTPLLDTFGAAS